MRRRCRLARLALASLVVAAPAAAELLPPRPIGRGPLYHPHPAASTGAPIGGMRCLAGEARRFGIHLEVFARRLVVLVPAGIGVVDGRRRGAYVVGGRCSYPLRTREPTGMVEARVGGRYTLGDLFRVWGAPLSRTRLAGFRAAAGSRVRAFVGGRPWPGDPRSIRLEPHAQIVLEVNGYVRPHASYRFPRGL